MFSKRLLRQDILILRGEQAPNKHEFLVNIFQSLKTPFLAFLQKFACGVEILVKLGSL